MSNVREGVSLLENPDLISSLRKKQAGLGAICADAVQFMIFACFITLFTALVLTEPFGDYYRFEQSIRGKFDVPLAKKSELSLARMRQMSGFSLVDAATGEDGGEAEEDGTSSDDGAAGAAATADANSDFFPSLQEVTTVEEWYDYMANTFYDHVYIGDRNTTTNYLSLDAFNYNLIIGRIRIRNKRVTPDMGCEVDANLSGAFKKCYGPYDESYEATKDIGGATEAIKHTVVPDDTHTYEGQLADYNPGGYITTLNTNGTATLESLGKLRLANFVDLQSRAIFVDFNVWNPNMGFFGAVKLVFEISPAGKFANRMDFTVLTKRQIQFTLNQDNGDADFKLLFEFLLLGFMMYYFLQEISEATVLKWEYLSDGWNYLDWTNLVLIVVAFIYRVYALGGASVFEDLAKVNKFTDLSGFAYYVNANRQVNALNSMLIWVKCLKYVPFIPFVTTMMDTIRYSFQNFVSFFTIFLCIFVGFAIGFTQGFGDKSEDLQNFARTVLFLLRSLVGNADFSVVYASSAVLGGLLIILFVLLIYFIMMNLWMAIMTVALSEAKAQALEEEEDSAWDKFKERVNELYDYLYDQLELDEKIMLWLPGLHARLQNRKDEKASIEARRAEQKELLVIREKINRGEAIDEDSDFDDGGPTGAGKVPRDPEAEKDANGEKKKRAKGEGGEFGNTGTQLQSQKDAHLGDGYGESDSDASEEDIGILSQSRAKLRKKRMAQGHATESEIIMESAQHIATVLAKRGLAVKDIVTAEMLEVNGICSVISDVLEILARRTADLNTQQKGFLSDLGVA